MQLSLKSLSVLLLAGSSVEAVPLHRHNIHEGLAKRELWTETIRQTRIHYRRQVVVVDQNSNAISTGVEPAYTSTINDNFSQLTPVVKDNVINLVTESSSAETIPTSTQTFPVFDTPSPIKSTLETIIISTQGSTLVLTTDPAPESTTESDPGPQSQSKPLEPTSSSTTSPTQGEFSGDGTFYNTGLGSCGIVSNDSEFVVALGYELYDSVNTPNPNNNPLCGRKITVFRGNKSVQVTVVDRCPGCSSTSLDLSPAAFNVLGAPEEGRISITWKWD